VSAQQPAAESGSADLVAGFLAAAAIFAALAALVYHPLRLDPIAIVLSLVALGMSTRNRGLAMAAALLSGLCFLLGMTIAVVTSHPLW
jgi:hypothetical protein